MTYSLFVEDVGGHLLDRFVCRSRALVSINVQRWTRTQMAAGHRCWLVSGHALSSGRLVLYFEPTADQLDEITLKPKFMAPEGAPVDPNPVQGVAR